MNNAELTKLGDDAWTVKFISNSLLKTVTEHSQDMLGWPDLRQGGNMVVQRKGENASKAAL